MMFWSSKKKEDAEKVDNDIEEQETTSLITESKPPVASDISNDAAAPPPYSLIKGILACILYMLVGPSLVLVNKYILSDLKFSYPMTVSGIGVLFTGITARLLVYFKFAKLDENNVSVIEGSNYLKKVLISY